MLRHDDISEDMEVISEPHLFKLAFEEVPRAGGAEVREPAVTTEGQEVRVSGTLITNQALSHLGILSLIGQRKTGLL